LIKTLPIFIEINSVSLLTVTKPTYRMPVESAVCIVASVAVSLVERAFHYIGYTIAD